MGSPPEIFEFRAIEGLQLATLGEKLEGLGGSWNLYLYSVLCVCVYSMCVCVCVWCVHCVCVYSV